MLKLQSDIDINYTSNKEIVEQISSIVHFTENTEEKLENLLNDILDKKYVSFDCGLTGDVVNKDNSKNICFININKTSHIISFTIEY